MYLRSKNSWVKHLDFMLADILCLNIAYILAYLVRFRSTGGFLISSNYINFLLVVNIIEVVASIATDNLSDVLRRGKFVETEYVITLSVITFAITTCFMFLAHNSGAYSRLLVAYTFVIFAVLDLPARLLLKKLVIRRLRSPSAKAQESRSLFVVTEHQHLDALLDEIENEYLERFNVNGILLVDAPDAEMTAYKGIRLFTDEDAAAQYICREWIDEVLVFSSDWGYLHDAFISRCKEMAITVHYLLNLQNVEHNKQFVERLGERTVLTTAYNYITPRQAFMKRFFDILGGLVGSAAAALIGIVIAPIIKHKSPGPVIFKQTRIGQNGRQFKVYKFRSMYPDADERKKEYLAQNRVADGMMFKLDFDPRIIGNEVLPDGTHKTGIGEFIRKTSLDEFPQFFNVLKGDMSLVGTRPPTLDEWEKYAFHHRARLAMKPGITGMWQVSGRSEIRDFEEVVRLDTEYITQYRFSLDIKIFFKTILVIFQRKGAM